MGNIKNKNRFFLEKGSVMIYSLMVLIVILTITFTLLRLFLPKFKIASESIRSVAALYSADSALEWCLYTFRSGSVANVGSINNGSTVTASSEHISGSYPATRAIDDDLTGPPPAWYWNDNTVNTFPDWLEVDFGGSKMVNSVVVYSVQDNFAAPVVPDDTMTFTLYGLVNFSVEYWNGLVWNLVPGGSITGNNKIIRRINFPTLYTNRIRINITSTGDNIWSRIVEVEAFHIPPPTTQLLMSNNATYQIYRGGTVSTCPSSDGDINYRAVGTYRNISRSLEVFEQ